MSWVRVDASEVYDLVGDIKRNADAVLPEAQLVMEKTGYDMQAHAMELCPVDTGNLRSSISIDFGALSFDLGPTADYGDAVERGVPHPFTIRARDGGVLHFFVDGHEVFAKSVVHPPMAPQPYLSPAFDAGLSDAEDALGQLGEQVLYAVG